MKRLVILLLFIPNILFAQKPKLPYELKTVQELYYYGAGSLLWASSLAGNQSKNTLDKDEIKSQNIKDVNYIDRFACYNYNNTLNTIRESLEPVTTGLAFGGTLAMAVMNNYREDNLYKIIVMGNMYIEGLLITTGIAQATKAHINRARPYTYNENLYTINKLTKENNESFISGNTSLLFYNSVFIAKTYEDLFPNSRYSKWVWAGGLALSCTSAYMSVRSGRHFLTDALAGAAVGSLIGYFIPKMHYRKDFLFKKIKCYGSIHPQVYPGGFGARLAIGLN